MAGTEHDLGGLPPIFEHRAEHRRTMLAGAVILAISLAVLIPTGLIALDAEDGISSGMTTGAAFATAGAFVGLFLLGFWFTRETLAVGTDGTVRSTRATGRRAEIDLRITDPVILRRSSYTVSGDGGTTVVRYLAVLTPEQHAQKRRWLRVPRRDWVVAWELAVGREDELEAALRQFTTVEEVGTWRSM